MNMWVEVMPALHAGHDSDISEITGECTQGELASRMSGRSESDWNKLTISGFKDSEVWIQGINTLWPMGEMLPVVTP